MKNFKAIHLLPLAVVLLFSSCTVYTKNIATTSVETQIQFKMEDLEYIGDVSGTATQTTLLGVIPIGGRRFHVASIGGGGLVPVPQGRLFNNALYDALMQRENADFVLPLSSSSVQDGMFLGNKTTLTVRAKAFRIKSK
ncbi:MAG: hypothetical protein IPN62_04590 [Flavobacteriales bacterium]|jgi:hypothetical protein|nr:hypothetical protein [Flavobacteriales bacterium]MBP7450308.1 hypothetical protein [Flavobacteriales bacterium]HOZ41057.1 hypothetical protein [Flavobacteriales bacterium]